MAICVSWYQKGKRSLDFTETRESGNGISWAICEFAPHARQITRQHPTQFLTTYALPILSLPLTLSCSKKFRLVLVLPFWYQLTRVVPDKIQRAVNQARDSETAGRIVPLCFSPGCC